MKPAKKKAALLALALAAVASTASASRTDVDGAPLRVSRVERAQLETRRFELALERGVSMQRFRLLDSASIEALALPETRLPAFDFEEPLSRLELLELTPRNASSCAFSLAAGCLGKTIPADPLDYVDGPNVYAYARNNPLAYSDPMGTCVWIFKDTGYCKAVEEKISETIELVTGDPAAQADQQIAMNQARVAGIKSYEKTVGESPTSNSVVATTADHKGVTASGRVIDMSGQIEPANLEAAVIPGAIGARMAARAVAAAGGSVGRQVAAGAVSALDDAVGEFVGVNPSTVGSVAKATSRALLPGEGAVGMYDDLIATGSKGDNLTPHHIPSTNHMAQQGVGRGQGVSMMMEQPVPGVGGRHRATFTYGTTADAAMTARDALAAGVWDARKVYRGDDLYGPYIRQKLQQVIELNKQLYPELFEK